MTGSVIIALCCVALAWLWTAHLRRKQEAERRAQLEQDTQEAEDALKESLANDKDNLLEHKRLRDRWLQFLSQH